MNRERRDRCPFFAAMRKHPSRMAASLRRSTIRWRWATTRTTCRLYRPCQCCSSNLKPSSSQSGLRLSIPAPAAESRPYSPIRSRCTGASPQTSDCLHRKAAATPWIGDLPTNPVDGHFTKARRRVQSGRQSWFTIRTSRMESEQAMRPIPLAVNRLHHPDEPDGVQTRDAAITASATGAAQATGSASTSMPDMRALSLVAPSPPTYPPKLTKAEMHSTLASASG